jgi:alkanesulfonate monooxygenase SsuD/methylene tetrahydromethanopterin reductase-like flavin-dependent oxidoreductase (luciferase family)
MQIGILLTNGEVRQDDGRVVRWSEVRDMAQAAEGVGFDTVWLADHLLYRNSGTVVMPPGKTAAPFEAFTLLGAMAEATKRVEIGPFVACNSFRNPALLAKIADTLDEISGGRLILGLGAGWHQPEYDAFGYPFDHLASRFDEALQVIVPLLRTGHVDFKGTYYEARDCELRPRGPRGGGIPIWIGAAGPRMMRLAARYADAFNHVWNADPSEAEPSFQRFDEACREVGRDPSTARRTSGVFVISPGMGCDYASPKSITGSSEEIARRILAFKSIGVDHVTLIVYPLGVQAIEGLADAVRMVRAG